MKILSKDSKIVGIDRDPKYFHHIDLLLEDWRTKILKESISKFSCNWGFGEQKVGAVELKKEKKKKKDNFKNK